MAKTAAEERAQHDLCALPADDREHVRIFVNNMSAPAAYCWSNRTVFVSRRLLDVLDDSELVAAMAHELGHLRHSPAVDARAYALGGSHVDEEQRADAEAVRMLAEVGRPAADLCRALEKVRDDRATAPSLKAGLTLRIQILKSTEK